MLTNSVSIKLLRSLSFAFCKSVILFCNRNEFFSASYFKVKRVEIKIKINCKHLVTLNSKTKSFSTSTLVLTRFSFVSVSLNIYLFNFSNCNLRFSRFLLTVFIEISSDSICSKKRNEKNMYNQQPTGFSFLLTLDSHFLSV